MTNLEVGQKVKWVSGNVECKGVVLECKGELTDVVVHYIGTRFSGTTLEILTSVLIKVN